MRLTIVTPAAPGSRTGNRVTAERWARLLRGLGHRATIREEWRGEPCDILIALHARRSARSALRFAGAFPEKPLVVCLAGTDINPGLERSPLAMRTVRAATRLVALQPLAIEALPRRDRTKARVILQSAEPQRPAPRRRDDVFEVAVVGHLRRVKDPFRAALAARLLPASSRVNVTHAGRALDAAMGARARREMTRNPRYRWLGGVSHAAARGLIARSRLLVVSSWSEGGANVVSEALVAGTPVAASRVPGNVGLLGADWPAYFEAGDTEGLAALMTRLESDRSTGLALAHATSRLAPSFRPAAELAAWRHLIGELS